MRGPPLMPGYQNTHLDWGRNSFPIPYAFQDLESRAYEFSECFCPGESATYVIRYLRYSFGQHFHLSAGQLRQLRTDPLQISDQMLEQAAKQADYGGVEGILAFILNYVENDSQPQAAITQARALRVSRQLRQLMPVLTREAAAALELSYNPPATLRATAQTSQLFNHTAEIFYICLAAYNLSNTSISDYDLVSELFSLTAKLIIAFSGIAPTQTAVPNQKTPQSYILSNARCFAGIRVLALNRHCLLRMLGRTKDFARVDEMRAARMAPATRAAIYANQLPAPRFSGYVNGICAYIRYLEDLCAVRGQSYNGVSGGDYRAAGAAGGAASGYNNAFNDGYAYNANNSGTATNGFSQADSASAAAVGVYQMKSVFNQAIATQRRMPPNALNEHQLFYDQILQRRKMFYNAQECDSLYEQYVSAVVTMLSALPQTRLKGSLESIENVHGAYLAIKMAADCRNQTACSAQTPSFGANSIRYNYQQMQVMQPNEATQFMHNRLANSYTKLFNYCGRPNVEAIVCSQLIAAVDSNFEGFYASNIDITKVKMNILNAFPLNLPGSILRQPAQHISRAFQLAANQPNQASYSGGSNPTSQTSAAPSEINLLTIMQSVDFVQYLRALAHFGLCGTPNNADTIFMRHLMPDPTLQPTNNSLACVKHVREVVLKQVSHMLFLLSYKAAQLGTIYRAYMARLYSKIPELQEFLICVVSYPLGVYTMTPDQRFKQFGLCLFEDIEEAQTSTDQLSNVTYILHGRPAEVRNMYLSTYCCTRRMLILNCVLRIIYGIVAHSRHRYIYMLQLYNRVSANYVSAMMQSALGETVEESDGAPSTPLGQRRLSNVIGGLSSLGINSKLASYQLDPLNINSFYDFITGTNASNNPTKQNMACTLSCTFPCHQALRVDNLSVLVAFLKLAIHILPTFSSSESSDMGSIFEVPGLSEARNVVTKLAYLTGVSAKKVDVFRFNREAVCSGEEERDWQEARELLRAFSGKLSIDWLEADIKNGQKSFADSVVDAELGYCGKYAGS